MALFIDSCLWVAAVAAGIIFVLLQAFKLPRCPKERARAFVKRSRAGPIAHRGGNPENTLGAFRRAKAEGASSVEVDLEFTRDGHPVLLHDSTVDRTSNGSGRVADMTLEEVKRLDFGSKYGPEFKGERIPTLYEVVDLCEELDMLMFLELKKKTHESAVAVQRLFAGRPDLCSRVAVISFWPRMLYKVRCASPDVICGLSVISDLLVLYPDGSKKNKARWRHVLSPLCGLIIYWVVDMWLWRFLGISILLPFKNDILSSRVDVKKWEERGVPVVTWTVNKSEEKLHFRDVLRLPYLTDCCQVDRTVPEQVP